MASTTLFAPSVRVVQPAFIYSNGSGTVKVYFTLNYNTIDQVQKLSYSLIDPNKSSIDGGNSMFSSGSTKEVETENIHSNNREYYFDIDLSDGFKLLTINQFYQVQIELWDGGDWSLPSTVSLIRPIPEISASSMSIDGQKLTGQIGYDDESTIETIASYQYNIKQGSDIVYPSPRITNFLGLRFETTIPYAFAEDQEYTIELTYTTKHGYTSSLFTDIDAKIWSNVTNLGTLSSDYPKVNIADGAIEFKFDTLAACKLQKASEYTNYKIWSDVAYLTSSDKDKIIQDILLEGKGRYQYRLVKKKEGAEIQDSKQDLNTIEMHYDDIFLSDKDYMFALRYNPKISNFKWVTQDSITNTLGGKYPLIRRNGDQFYKQFGISGTLYLDWPETVTETCSIGKTMADFFVEESCSLYLSQTKITAYNQATLKKKMRDIIAEFLSNGSIKLLRSEEEGLMLVYLSGVSFTPNATSGRRVYDFSATATEICEATEANIAKYLPTRTGASNYFTNASKIS